MKIYKLKNQLQVIFIPNKQIDFVSIELKAKAGSNYENKDEVGVAHMTEHLMLSQNSNILSQVGGKVWGITSRDDSIIYIKVLKEYFENAIEYLSSLILKSEVTHEDLNIQKSIINHEIARSLSNPEKVILRRSYKNLFFKTRMEKLNTGEVEDIEKINIEQIKKFKNTHYSAKNMIIAITGNLDKKILQRVLDKYLEKITSGEDANVPIIQTTDTERTEIYKGNYNQIHIKIDYLGYTLKDKKRYALSLLSFILNTELNNKIKSKKGLCYIISSQDFYSTTYGTLSIYTATNNKDIIKEINQVLKEIEINDIEVAKINVISELIFGLENPSQQLDFYCTNYLYDNKISLKNEINNYKKVTINDVKKVYKEITNQKQKITILEPLN